MPDYSSSFTSTKKFNVSYIRDTVESDALQPEIKDSIREAIAQLKAQGHTVEAIDFPLMEYILLELLHL